MSEHNRHSHYWEYYHLARSGEIAFLIEMIATLIQESPCQRGERSNSGRPPIHSKDKLDFVCILMSMHRSEPLLFFKPVCPTFQARFRQAACSASHSSLWFTNPHTTSLIRSYFFSGFRYTLPIIRQVLILWVACPTQTRILECSLLNYFSSAESFFLDFRLIGASTSTLSDAH